MTRHKLETELSRLSRAEKAEVVERLAPQLGDGALDLSIERAIAGALRSTIHDHGPITAESIGSATKRVAGNLANVLKPLFRSVRD